MTRKDKVILITAAVIPFGFTAIGVWKTYEIIKGIIDEKRAKKSFDLHRDIVNECIRDLKGTEYWYEDPDIQGSDRRTKTQRDSHNENDH